MAIGAVLAWAGAALAATHEGVQLWENGPLWAKTNVGAFYGTIRVQEETMTESEIASIETEIADYNSEQEEKALAKFKKGPVPKMKWVMERTLECLLGCIAAVKSGKPPEGRLGPYMSDELARILATETCLSYDGLTLDENAAIEADSGTCFEDVSDGCGIAAWTPEFGQWRRIVTALGEYLYSAAVLAKSVNPSSTAARLYLRAWRIVQWVENRARNYGYAQKDEALAIVRLERVASERLRVDAQFAALPPFKKAKKPRSGKAKKGAKAN